MKTNFKNIGLVFLATIALLVTTNEMASKHHHSSRIYCYYKRRFNRQNTKFTATAGSGTISLTSAKGVSITINGNALTKNGSPVTGPIDITYVEILTKDPC
jgi:hypothetical protein